MEQSCKFDVYKGDWADDKPNGKGVYVYQYSGIIIEGMFKDGQLDGQGMAKIRYVNGDIYEGGVANSKRHGRGKLYYQNGDYYEGDWAANKKEGKGKFYIKAEDLTIEGTFLNDEMHQGRMIDKVGNIYSTVSDEVKPGKFSKGKLQGKVKVDYANGNAYHGMFIDGKKSGQGKMIYMNLKMHSEDDEMDKTFEGTELKSPMTTQNR